MPFDPKRFLAETDPDTGIDNKAFDPNKFLTETAPPAPPMGFLEGAGRATVNHLPMIGAVAGGVLGTPFDVVSGPLGTATGAGMGAYLGSATKNLINSYIDPAMAPASTADAILTPAIEGGEAAAQQLTGEALMGPVVNAATKVSPVVAAYLNKIAETRAGKALGATKAAFRKYGQDAIRKVGRYGLDEGVISPLASAETMAERNAVIGQDAMKARQGVYDAIDQGGAARVTGEYPSTVQPDYGAVNPSEMTPRRINGAPEFTNPQLSQLSDAGDIAASANLEAANSSGFNPYSKAKPAGASKYNPYEAAQAIEKGAGDINPLDPLDSAASGQLDKSLQSVRLRGQDNISMNAAQEVQEKLARQANFDATRSSAINDVAENIAMSHREYLNQAAENAAGDIGGDGLKATIQKANQQYSQGRDAAKLLNNRTSSELGNKTFGLTDTIIAATAHNPLMALGEVGIKKTAEGYGNQTSAVGADWLRKVVQDSPQALGRWSAPLSQAAARGMNSLAATDYILQQTDPEYRKHLNTLKSDPYEQ